jgi:dihydroflavonol-4-reductase
VAKTLLTGGSGLIGSHVARALLERGDELRLGLRASSKLDNLGELEFERVRLDILDRQSVRRALKGVDRVFHAAGLTSLRASAERAFRINVRGTRVVLEECLRAGVERVVYTSSVGAIGPAPRGGTADETQIFRAGDLGVPYINAKHEAEVEAMRLAARGLPVVIVNPTHVFGGGDIYRSSTDIVRRFLSRDIPAYVDGAINVADVKDVARGHLLADERGKPGERYILGNRNFTFDRLFADLGRLSGVEPPAVKLPLGPALAFAAALERLPGRPLLTVGEVRAASRWWTYRSTKARDEIGWKPRPHEETLQETIEWYREREPSLPAPGTRQPFGWRVAGFAVNRIEDAAKRIAG